MSSMQIDNVLAQIRALQSQVKVGAPHVTKPGAVGVGAGAGVQGAGPTSFANVLKQGLDRVNETQSRASDMATKFEKGVPGVELSQVMLESQKASVAFRATVEVRNRLVSAYQEIMNMPI
jgi:flagellar hook-basal body complex protein FliE